MRQNGLNSPQPRTRDAIKRFDAQAYLELPRIARELLTGRFEFALQDGVLLSRGAGKAPRPVVVAAIKNRVVQRAILDVLQRVRSIRSVLLSDTSFGGIATRGVRTAIAETAKALEAGHEWFYRSDIKDFFTKIPRERVVQFVIEATADAEISELLKRAAETKLRPESVVKLGEDVRLFPLDGTGVAQGSALSAFMGNILLRDFDQSMNTRGIRFIRYIDDFLVLGPSARHVKKAFESARTQLSAFDMTPYEEGSGKKASFGRTTGGLEFLGARIRRGRVEPSEKSKRAILERIGKVVSQGKQTIGRISKGDGRRIEPRTRFVQTVSHVDLILEGWSKAVDYCDPRTSWEDLDRRVDDLLTDLLLAFRRRWRTAEDLAKRRQMLGVRMLRDIKGMEWKDLMAMESLE